MCDPGSKNSRWFECAGGLQRVGVGGGVREAAGEERRAWLSLSPEGSERQGQREQLNTPQRRIYLCMTVTFDVDECAYSTG